MRHSHASIALVAQPVNQPDPAISDVMLLPEAAAFLRCHPETLKKICKTGGVPHRRVGSGWRFSRSALTHWMKQDQDRAA
jgi:excisionase family DNA binding protein